MTPEERAATAVGDRFTYIDSEDPNASFSGIVRSIQVDVYGFPVAVVIERDDLPQDATEARWATLDLREVIEVQNKSRHN